jgi:exosortase
MPNPTTESVPDGLTHSGGESVERSYWGPLILASLALIWFYVFETRYGVARHQSALGWLWSAWNPETGYEHGPMFPLIVAGLIFHRFQTFKSVVSKPEGWGLLIVFIGAAFYAAGYRTLQPRVAVGALPILLWGAAWFFWGRHVAKKLIFPLFFFWLAVPLPSFQQGTVHLQMIATSSAHHVSSLFGVETIVKGTEISSAQGKWDPLEIAGGCSGIRSLMALLMISGAWAYISDMVTWKRVLLFLSAFPLAILGNILRVTSIFVIAEYGDAYWAHKTWHDWSGLLLFYPFSLMLLLVLHSLLEGGLPWKKRALKQVRRMTVTRQVVTGQPETTAQES